MKKLVFLLVLLTTILPGIPAQGQVDIDTTLNDPEPVIDVGRDASDDKIMQRIVNIFEELDPLSKVSVVVHEGVVTLGGEVSNEASAQRAQRLAIRIEGVVTVVDEINRTLDIEGNVTPMVKALGDRLRSITRAFPLLLLAFIVFAVIAYVGNLLAGWSKLWTRIAPNHFLAEIISQAVRLLFLISGIVVALNLIGATALMGTILGGAGVLGLAIGFAVRDTMENYISSIMLSLRQPFRANDHVLINEHEGIVIRLTSRATILMTTSGNHLRIPNSTVFKAVIQNYTTNPERRFDFALGVDAADDPIAAISTGIDAICALEFVLPDPKPKAIIEDIGDSSTIIRYMAWVDQTSTDFGKARTLAISASLRVLEENGFTLPEPIYRLRFDQGIGMPAIDSFTASKPSKKATGGGISSASLERTSEDSVLLGDVKPDSHLSDKANEERALSNDDDLLDHSRPAE